MFNRKGSNCMNTKKIKTSILTLATAAFATFGMAACDKNTEPGETNVERSDIVEEGEIIDQESAYYRDTTDLEKYYDHADHETHEDSEGGAVHAGDGIRGGNDIERDELQ